MKKIIISVLFGFVLTVLEMAYVLIILPEIEIILLIILFAVSFITFSLIFSLLDYYKILNFNIKGYKNKQITVIDSEEHKDLLKKLKEFTARISIIGDLSGESSKRIKDQTGLISDKIKTIMNDSSKISEQIKNIDPSIKWSIELSGKLIRSIENTMSISNRQIKLIRELEDSLPKIIRITEENTQKIKMTEKESEILSKSATKGSKSVLDAINSIQQMNESQKKLENFVKVINDIAEDTQTLSINASIEAANSGHAGTGFAVVAGEIRKLAQKSKEQAQNASVIIEELRNKLDLSMVLSKEGDDALHSILSGVTKTVGVIAELYESIKKQSRQTSFLKEVIVNLTGITNEVKQSIGNQNDQMLSFEESLNKLYNISNEINPLLENEKKVVSSFENTLSLLQRIIRDSKVNGDMVKIYISKSDFDFTKRLFTPVDKNIEAKKVGLVFGVDGFGDEGFNDLGFLGFVNTRLKGYFPTEYTLSKGNKEGLYEESEYLIQNRDCKLIVYMAGHMPVTANAVEELSPNYSDRYFALIHGIIPVNSPNVISIKFALHEASYLGGVLASLCTKSKKVGFIGGTDIPLITAFLVGFNQGIKDTSPEVTLDYTYVEYNQNVLGFSDKNKAYEMARKMYLEQGIDIIFAPAGASTLGVIKASKDFNRYSIGVDTNQDSYAPGNVLTSVMLKIDVAVSMVIEQFFKDDIRLDMMLGLKENGVGLTNFKFTKNIIGEKNIKYIKNIKNKIINKEIKVPNYLIGETGDINL